MGRIFSAVFPPVAVTVTQDLFELVAPADSVVKVHGLEISQSSDTDSEQLHLLIHGGTASGSGGSTITPAPLDGGDAVFGGTVEANNTTQSVEGTSIHSAGFNVLTGYVLWWTPETRPTVSPSGLFIVELTTAPADELTMTGTLYFEEIGG